MENNFARSNPKKQARSWKQAKKYSDCKMCALIVPAYRTVLQQEHTDVVKFWNRFGLLFGEQHYS